MSRLFSINNPASLSNAMRQVVDIVAGRLPAILNSIFQSSKDGDLRLCRFEVLRDAVCEAATKGVIARGEAFRKVGHEHDDWTIRLVTLELDRLEYLDRTLLNRLLAIRRSFHPDILSHFAEMYRVFLDLWSHFTSILTY